MNLRQFSDCLEKYSSYSNVRFYGSLASGELGLSVELDSSLQCNIYKCGSEPLSITGVVCKSNLKDLVSVKTTMSERKVSIVGFRDIESFIKYVINNTDKKVYFKIEAVSFIGKYAKLNKYSRRRFYLKNMDVKVF